MIQIPSKRTNKQKKNRQGTHGIGSAGEDPCHQVWQSELVPGTHMEEGETNSHKLSSDITRTSTNVSTHIYEHKINK